jgi:hypothetical protein
MKFVFRFPPSLGQALASLSVFVILLVSLASVDQRVHDKFTDLIAGGPSVATWTDRAAGLLDTVSTAVRYQSIENAPMVLFATVGGVLFLFMVRT